jgi:Ni,Fe-hydrogenase III small subunit/Pyruvate/2-oxoacid:ferredoxin oxidoreductase delta subunit
MFDVLLARWKQGHRTMRYPAGQPPELPERFAGRPKLNPAKCPADCRQCIAACPTAALSPNSAGDGIQLDTGRCLFCRQCETACPATAITFSQDYRLAASQRDDLIVRGDGPAPAVTLEETSRRLFGRSLKLRQVSAGGCNACEADTNVLGTVAWDLSRFGIQFVASPRHADGLLITGPVTENMRLALLKTYEALPWPKLVIAVGACAVSGGPYVDHPEVHNGATPLIPVDLFIPVARHTRSPSSMAC